MKVPRWQSMLAAYRVRVPPRSRSWLPVSSRSPAWVHSWTGGIRPCTGIAQTASFTAQTLLPLFGILCGCWFSGSILPRLPAYDRGKVLRTSLSIGDPSRSWEPVCPRSWAHVPTHTSTPIPPPRTPTPLFLGTCPIADDLLVWPASHHRLPSHSARCLGHPERQPCWQRAAILRPIQECLQSSAFAFACSKLPHGVPANAR